MDHHAGEEIAANAVWGCLEPLSAASAVAGSFQSCGDKETVEVDGEQLG